MPNHHDWERIDLYAQEIALLRGKLRQVEDMLLSTEAGVQLIRADAAKVVLALDTAMQLIDSMMTFWPVNAPMPPQVAEARQRLAVAWDQIRKRNG